MRIGLDFDNTIAGYDRLFAALAEERNLFVQAPVGKRPLRDKLRRRDGGEAAWQQLQAAAYGARMGEAELIDGVSEFLTTCREKGDDVRIISHKTRYAHHGSDGVDLRDAALAWMSERGFFDSDGFGLDAANVSFHDTRRDKVACIAELAVDCFVDDLEEVFAEPAFPAAVRRILYDPSFHGQCSDDLTRCRNWQEIEQHVYGSDKPAG
jgi:hypothetical protein